MTYKAYLQNAVRESMFAETFSLSDVYIPARAFYEKTQDSEDEKDFERVGERKTQRIVIDLEAELEAWIESFDARDGVRLITGGPGCGKSSFVKMYAARLAAEKEIPVLFVPLHHLTISGSLA